MKCENEKCTREASVKNQHYFPDKWLCTYHANKATKEGRRKRKETQSRRENHFTCALFLDS